MVIEATQVKSNLTNQKCTITEPACGGVLSTVVTAGRRYGPDRLGNNNNSASLCQLVHNYHYFIIWEPCGSKISSIWYLTVNGVENTAAKFINYSNLLVL